MKQIAIFHCHTVTEASDRANLYYIASPSATGIQRDNQARAITITSRAGKALAVFQY